MKKVLMAALAICFCATQSQAQTLRELANGVLNEAKKTTTGNNSGSGLGAGLSNSQITNGLKEALTRGTQSAGSSLSKTNGFFGDALVKIAMPPEVQNVESALRQFGLSSLADKLVLSMNRAAEDAASKAVPIFVNAIRSISIEDGLSILRGGNNAATTFLQQRTNASLANAFRPVIQQSLGKVNATQYWNQAFSAYNKLPLGQKAVNTDLTAYVTEQALKGVFTKIGQEELSIRQNPLGTGSDLLKQVFGGK